MTSFEILASSLAFYIFEKMKCCKASKKTCFAELGNNIFTDVDCT
jgi:hypothetical protein